MAAAAYPEPSADPSDGELSRDWTLTEADRAEVLRGRGDAHRHRFALQLCALRALGHFIDDYATVAVRIINHVGRQLDLPPSLFVEAPDRPATATEQAQRIRAHLGFGPFDEPAEERLKTLLRERAAAGESLLALAVSTLRAWKLEIPARSTLQRLVNSIAAESENAIWHLIHARLSPDFCAASDRLLVVADGERHSTLFQLKQYPPNPKAEDLLVYLERFELLRSIGAAKLDFAGIAGKLLALATELGRTYDAKELRRFAPAKRYALVACFLVDAQKSTLDHLVDMHHEYLTGMRRRSRIGYEKRFRRVRRRFNRGLSTVLRAMDIVTDESMPKEDRVINLYMSVDGDELKDALAICREHHALGDHGLRDELLARHHHLKRYLPGFLKLPFLAQPGAEPLMEAIMLARSVHSGEIEHAPAKRPIGFVKGSWRATLGEAGCDFRLWEIGLAFAVGDALRSGDLYLAESRQHVSFWNMVHDAKQWEQKRAAAYAEMKLPTDGDKAIERLRGELDEAAGGLASGIGTNRFAKLNNGRLEHTRREATPEPAALPQLRGAIQAHLPLVRIEELLAEVDSWCGFSREFRPPDGYEPRVGTRHSELMAALVAHGTNLGLQTMAQSTKGISVDVLHDVTKWYLRDETFRAANRVLVDYHHSLPLSAVWGDSKISSSDGQRFGVLGSSLIASFYPRYYGYYERAVTVQTHMSDQFSVFSTQVISCSEREALHVLDGLLRNDTILRPETHTTDTHGFTEQLFGLCYLCGFSFMPRFKDLADQQLYRIAGSSYGAIDPIFRGGAVDTDLIREQWDPLVRVASSVLSKTAPAHVIMQRLQNSPLDRLAKALTMLGRVVKTAFILRYASEPKMRDGVHLQLNRGESRHQLGRRIFFANQGAFLSGDYEEIMCKATALSLLSNAVLAWNTVRMTEIVNALEATGEPVAREHLARISPLAHAHVIPSGTYHFDRVAKGRVATA